MPFNESIELVDQFAFTTLSPNASSDLVYTVPTGRTLTITSLELGTDVTAAGGRVELIRRPNGGTGSTDVTLDVLFACGDSVERQLDLTVFGDGAKVILRCANNGGGNIRIAARWRGYL